MKRQISFLKQAFKTFKTAGAIAPSSKYLAKRIINYINFDDCKIIVEYGSEDGVITKEILKRLL